MHKIEAPISLSVNYHGENPRTPDGLYLTLPDISELEGLPSSGTITFRYTRESLRLPKDNKLSAEICLCEITDVKGDKESEEKSDDTVDKLFAEAQKAREEDDEDDKE